MNSMEPESDIYSENEESGSGYLDELDSEDSMDEYENSFQSKSGEEEEGESDLEEKFSSVVDDTSKYKKITDNINGIIGEINRSALKREFFDKKLQAMNKTRWNSLYKMFTSFNCELKNINKIINSFDLNKKLYTKDLLLVDEIIKVLKDLDIISQKLQTSSIPYIDLLNTCTFYRTSSQIVTLYLQKVY